jgi:hypothetical protein
VRSIWPYVWPITATLETDYAVDARRRRHVELRHEAGRTDQIENAGRRLAAGRRQWTEAEFTGGGGRQANHRIEWDIMRGKPTTR